MSFQQDDKNDLTEDSTQLILKKQISQILDIKQTTQLPQLSQEKTFQGFDSLNCLFNKAQFSDKHIYHLQYLLLKFPNLQNLSLHFQDNLITNSGASFLSTSLSQLIQLQYLFVDLSYYSYSSQPKYHRADLIFSEMSQLHNISNLTIILENNQITDNEIESISKSIGLLKKITSLHLNIKRNNITNFGIQAISQAISSLPNLTTLILLLSSNPFGKIGSDYLSKSINSLHNIEILELEYTSIDVREQEQVDLFFSFFNLKNLKSLSLELSDNFTDFKITKQQSDAISQLTNLKTLKITLRFSLMYSTYHLKLMSIFNKIPNIKDFAFRLLPFQQHLSLTQNKKKEQKILERFNVMLNNQQIKDSEIKDLSEIFSNKLNKIKKLVLHLEQNEISQFGATIMSSHISQLPLLEYLTLNLAYNTIGNQGVKVLSLELIKIQQLKSLKLNLSKNSIDESGFQELSLGISKFQQLENLTLNVSSNNFGTSGESVLAVGISKLSKLKTLHFQSKEMNLQRAQQFLQHISNSTIFILKFKISESQLQKQVRLFAIKYVKRLVFVNVYNSFL